jgi:hypothetical protein
MRRSFVCVGGALIGCPAVRCLHAALEGRDPKTAHFIAKLHSTGKDTIRGFAANSRSFSHGGA